jgi:NAD(P)-dependent dehydrogenase (short-subunit alcohol dehydrogenase family)
MLLMFVHAQVLQAVQAAEAAHGPVDVLFCCAGAAELGGHLSCLQAATWQLYGKLK